MIIVSIQCKVEVKLQKNCSSVIIKSDSYIQKKWFNDFFVRAARFWMIIFFRSPKLQIFHLAV